jgi:hypothetical protein
MLHCKALIALMVACAAVLALSPGTAFAASEIGPANGPEVLCNPTTNTISVTPRFGAGDAYQGQWLSYRLWATNDRTGYSFWLSAGGQYSAPVWHQRVGAGYYDVIGNWYPGMDSPFVNAGSPSFTITGLDNRGAGEFHVHAQYKWYSPTNGWLGPITRTATLYNHIGLYYVTTMSYCQL